MLNTTIVMTQKLTSDIITALYNNLRVQ